MLAKTLDLKLGAIQMPADPSRFCLTEFKMKGQPLPIAPVGFGHQALVKQWGMLGNDKFGDCVLAGAAHESMLWYSTAGRGAFFSEKDVLSDYGAITGFDPRTGQGDNGTDPAQAARYRQKVGLQTRTAQGKLSVRVKIGAYLEFAGNNPNQARQALNFGEAVGMCFDWPDSAMDQFSRGQKLTVVKGAKSEGGHYIVLVGVLDENTLLFVCWGQLIAVDIGFIKKYGQASLCYISPGMIGGNGKSSEGFDMAGLQQRLASL